MTETKTPATDLRVELHGSVALVHPMTPIAQAWIAANVEDDAMWLGSALAVEPRYLEDLVTGAQDDGLVVRAAAE